MPLPPSLLFLALSLSGSPARPAPAKAAARALPRPPDAKSAPARFAPDIDPKALWDGRKTYAEFKAVNDPKMVRAADAKFLTDEEYILGLTVNGQNRAYP